VKKYFFIGDFAELPQHFSETFTSLFPMLKFEARIIDIQDKFENITDEIFKEVPLLIFIDATDHKEKVLEYLYFIGTHKSGFKTPIFSQFSNKEELDQFGGFFDQGSNYAFIKGCEDKNIIYDALEFSLTERIPHPHYALARNLDFSIPCFLALRLTSVTREQFTFSTDFEFSVDDVLESKIYIDEGVVLKDSKITSTAEGCNSYNYYYSYSAQIPFAGPWDEINEDSLLQPVFESWLETNKDQLVEKGVGVLIYDDRLSTFKEYLAGEYKKQFGIVLRSNSGIDENLIERSLPGVIIIQFEPTQEEVPSNCVNFFNNFESIKAIVNKVEDISSTKNYDPFIMVFNTEAIDDLLQQFCSYEKILTSKMEFSLSLMEDLLEKYNKSKHMENVLLRYYFSRSCTQNIFYIESRLIITGLTEHEMTFVSEHSFPLFTVVKIDKPFIMYLTIVPQKRMLANIKGMNHYLAFIHSIDEHDKEELRQLINYIISIPANEYQNISLDKAYVLRKEKSKELIEERDKSRRDELEKHTKEKSEKGSRVSKNSYDKLDLFNKKKYKGKSKL
jgi:hypothetical protein